MVPNTINLPPLHVRLEREPFDDYIILRLPEGQSEEMDYDSAIEWLVSRGAARLIAEKVADEVWNFNAATLEIKKPRLVIPTGTRSTDPILS